MKDNRSLRVAIHGFGRIGRTLLRAVQHFPNIEVVVISDLFDSDTMLHLSKYDSVHGVWMDIARKDHSIWSIHKREVQYYQKENSHDIPKWSQWNIDVVVDATGVLKSRSELIGHLNQGAKKVLLTAPSDDESIPMVVMGINDAEVFSSNIISCASCTTNSAAHMIQLIDEMCGIESSYITTVHSYTGDQRLHDAPHKDLRRARGAVQSIVPTSTGAAKALTRIFPHLSKNLGGCGMRVPVPDGSLTDITSIVRNPISTVEINEAFRQASEHRWKGIVEYTEDPIVSSDVIGNSHSCWVDGGLTSVIGNMVKVVGWYDNEVGYSNRLCDVLNLWAHENV